MNQAVLDVGFQQAQQALQRSNVGGALMMPIESLKPYFRLDNRYVARKVGVLLLPFGRVAPRQRCGLDDDVAREAVEYFPPVDDVAAPDLYIPVMGLLTYVVNSAFAKSGSTPEAMAAAVVSAATMLLGEVLLLKAAGFIVSVPGQLKWLDLTAWCGYKYVALCLTVALGQVLPSLPLFGLMTYFALSSCYFILMTLRPYCARDGKVVMKTAPFLYGAAVLQCPLYYLYATRAL